MDNEKILLNVKNLYKFFVKNESYFKAINNANFHVNESDFFGIIGESGSGKSTIGKTIIRLLQADAGNIIFDNKVISNSNNNKKLNKFLANNMQMVFQDPMASLNPKKNVLSLISEPLIVNKSLQKNAKSKIREFLEICPLDLPWLLNEQNKYLEDFYHHFYKNCLHFYQEALVKVREFKLERDIPYQENKFKFVEILDDLEQNIKQTLTGCYEFVDSYQDILQSYDNYQTENPTSKLIANLDSQIEKSESLMNLIKYSDEYLKIQNQIEDIENKISNLKNSSDFINVEDNKKFVVNFIRSLKKDISFTKQELNTTSDYLTGMDIQIKILQKALNIECLYRFDQLIYLNKLDILKSYEQINRLTFNFFEDKYILIDSLKHKPNVNQTNKLNEWIKNFDITYVANQLDLYSLFDLNKYDSYKKGIDVVHQINLLNQTKNNLVSSLKMMKKDKSYLVNKSTYLERKNKVKQSLKKLNNLKKDLIHFTKTNNKSIIHNESKRRQQILEFAKKSKKQLNRLVYELNWEVKKQLLTFRKQDQKTNWYSQSGEYKSLKSDIKIKSKLLKVVYFEFKNNADIIKLFRNLYSTNKLKIYLSYFDLKDNIKLNMVYKALNEVGLKNEHAYRYPHEFSGGQRQRIVIARALINNPKLIIADEAISALDVSVQAQVINIMKSLAKQKNITFIFIAHDLSMVNYACNRMIIMHNGRILEKGDTKEIFQTPIHPYTISLMNAAPELSKIHVNLAQFSEQITSYDPGDVNDYLSRFYPVPNHKEHYVYGKKEEVDYWCQKAIH